MSTVVRPRDAVSVMMVRDAPHGMEIFMLKRNCNLNFGSGAYVFPGGSVDETDKDSNLECICEGLSDRESSNRLGIESGGLAFWVAAIRECFEEAGILLAYDKGGKIISFSDRKTAKRFETYRDDINGNKKSILHICREEGLRLAVNQLYYFSHWITPLDVPHRFDTRFFVCEAPPEQVPVHDNGETVEHRWIRPRDALKLHKKGELKLIFPTIKHLEDIGKYKHSSELLAVARTKRYIPAILPQRTHGPDGVKILLPGDPGYGESALRSQATSKKR